MIGWIADLINRRRLRAAQARRALDVAQTPAWASSWSGSAQPLNLDLASGLPTAVGRSRNLWRNNDYARRYRELLLSNVLGPAGLPLQMRMVLRDGRPNASVNDRIEDAWYEWGERGNCDVTGALEWAEIESLCLESLARDGEILLRRTFSGPHGFQLQLIDATLLDAALNQTLAGGRRIAMGVEIDGVGRPLAYHLRNDGRTEFQDAALYSHVRIPASEIIHRFRAEEAGQVRGWPWMSTSARRLWLVQDFEQSASVASSNAAKRLGFFVSPTGEAPPGIADQIVTSVLDMAKSQGKVLTAEEVEALSSAATRYATTVPGQFDTLPAGYDFRAFDSDYPHVNHGEYVKSCIRGVACGLGISYVSLANDLESVNYSSARVGILEEREHYKRIQAWLVCALHKAVFEAWLPMALLRVPELRTLDVARLPQYLRAATWQARRWAGIDPLKEANAAEKNVALKLTSRRRLIAERGDDPDEVFAEIAQEESQFGPIVPAEPAAPEPAEEPDDDETPQPARARLRAVRSMSL